jgi:Ca-activated chloride channel family protein
VTLEVIWLRPWWLLLLPLLAWLVWARLRNRSLGGAWTRVVTPDLQPHVLSIRGGGRDRMHVSLIGLAGLLTIVALAGPAWERRPQPLFRSDSGLVVVLDLSRSMDARDIAPSRLERAKDKVRKILLRHPADQVGLVAYTSEAFVLTPLTTDGRNIELQLPALTTDVMPTQGSAADVGLRRGGELLERAGLRRGDLLLITDEAGGESARKAASELAGRGYRTSVLAVGTAHGAPIPLSGGGFLTHEQRVVIPQLNAAQLRAVAADGQGRFAMLSTDDHDLDLLLARLQGGSGGSVREMGPDSELWVDAGPSLMLLLLPLALLAFRRGSVAAILLVLSFGIPAAHSAGKEWRDLLRRPDQQAREALRRGDAARAVELFTNPAWHTAALYQAGRFSESAAAWAKLDTPDAHYNRGNALAKSGQLEQALAAYEQALALAPNHADARYNHALVTRFSQQKSNQENANSSMDTEDGDDERSGAGRGMSEQKQGETQGDAPPNESQSEAPGGKDEVKGKEDRELSQFSEEDVQSIENDANQPKEQALRQVPDDPGGLLRRKFQRQSEQQGSADTPRGGVGQQPW